MADRDDVPPRRRSGTVRRTVNQGIMNTGPGAVHAEGAAVGAGAHVVHGASARGGPTDRWEIGVVTMLAEETAAVRAMLGRYGGCSPASPEKGPGCYEGRVGSVRVAVIRTLDQGHRSAMAALDRLRRAYRPKLVLLVGIAGAIHDGLSLGDVVIAHEVIYYDLRKQLGDRTLHRLRVQPVPARGRHAVNAFFTDRGSEPAALTAIGPDGAPARFAVHHGPVASGEAVIAHRDAEVLALLRAANDKVLAVEMEGGAPAQAFYEEHDPASAADWLIIRGISDYADPDKNDDHHHAAAANAAAVLDVLIPYLMHGAPVT